METLITFVVCSKTAIAKLKLQFLSFFTMNKMTIQVFIRAIKSVKHVRIACTI